VSVARQDPTQLFRVPTEDDVRARLSLASPDPALNPYLAFALLIQAGLDGVAEDTAAKRTESKRVRKSVQPTQIPDSLLDAIVLAERSSFLRAVLGPEFLSRYLTGKQTENAAFSHAESKRTFYDERYFPFL
jgi:glutamine synthetase